MEPYSVEGLGVGATVARNSREYKRYRCRQSEQYAGSITCRFNEVKDGINNTITILHLYNDVVTYINKSVSPAFFSQSEIEQEIHRLSGRFGSPPRIHSSRVGIIATWGDIELEELIGSDLAVLRDGRSPNAGFLVDHLMNFHESARSRLPVYKLAGGKGFVWIARFAKKGKEGTLRFLAADPSKMIQTGARPSPEKEQIPNPPPHEPAPSPDSAKQNIVSTGTGFFISSAGALVTNAHVVEDCDRLQVLMGLSLPLAAHVLARDRANDLALLKTDAKTVAQANLRAGVKIGESIAVFGYPLLGLLSTKGNFTVGNVAATAGLGDDTRYLQISAPIQSGNSGGPVLDQRGNVVGVVVSKLNALKVAEESHDLAQNVNFAIKTTVLMNFLDVNGVSYETSSLSASLSSADLAERAKSISALIMCEKQTH